MPPANSHVRSSESEADPGSNHFCHHVSSCQGNFQHNDQECEYPDLTAASTGTIRLTNDKTLSHNSL
jgi:hypothetical protein